MESDPDKEKSIPHIPCSLCTPKLMAGADKEAGKGLLHNFLDELIIGVIHEIPYNTKLALFSTSKLMNYYCQFSDIWKCLAKKENIQLNPLLCTIDQVKEFYSPFGNTNKEYTMTFSQMLPLMVELLPDPPVSWSITEQKTWCFSKRKSTFQITHYGNLDDLKLLGSNPVITFSWQGDPFNNMKPCLSAYLCIIVNPEDAENLEFGTPGYVQLASRMDYIWKVRGSSFKIRKIEQK